MASIYIFRQNLHLNLDLQLFYNNNNNINIILVRHTRTNEVRDIKAFCRNLFRSGDILLADGSFPTSAVENAYNNCECIVQFKLKLGRR